MKYFFDWDPKKAKENIKNHKVSFQRASTVFRDPKMITIYDVEHSEPEERWVTMGLDENGILLVVSHTFHKDAESMYKIRIISARKAVKREITQYNEVNL
jgi:uncharacterized DUF497 family protein